jgi:hypothetical protein
MSEDQSDEGIFDFDSGAEPIWDISPEIRERIIAAAQRIDLLPPEKQAEIVPLLRMLWERVRDDVEEHLEARGKLSAGRLAAFARALDSFQQGRERTIPEIRALIDECIAVAEGWIAKYGGPPD